MIPTSFEYVKASSVQEAISLLADRGDDARLLAGGHSLIPAMKLRLNNSSTLIDISGIAELSEIRLNGDKIEVGALVTHRSVERSEVAQKNCPVLAAAAGKIGDPQVRNRGTLGGSLAHADPAADYPALLLALDAEIHLTGKNGQRTVAVDDFFTGLFETEMQSGEVITKVSFPVLKKGAGAAYKKFAHPASRFAVVGVAASLTLDGGACSAVRVAITGAAASVFRARDAEKALVGKAIDEASVSAACASIADPADLLSDLHASAEYRANLCSVLSKRALLAAAELAK